LIGTDITVTVLAVKGNQVRIGINAPKDVTVTAKRSLNAIRSEQHPAVRRNVSAGFIDSWLLAMRHPGVCGATGAAQGMLPCSICIVYTRHTLRSKRCGHTKIAYEVVFTLSESTSSD